MNPFPVDIWSVKEFGVERWRREFFWPVTNQELRSLNDEIEHLYLDMINHSPPDVADALWVVYSWGIVGVPALLHALMVTQRIQKKGRVLSYHPSSKYYPALIAGEMIESLIGKPLPKIPSWSRKWRGQLQASMKNTTYHGLDIGRYFGQSRKQTYLATNYSDKYLQKFSSFATAHDHALTIIHPVQLMPASLKRTGSLPGGRQAVECFVEGLDKIARSYEVQIDARRKERVSKLFTDSLHYIADYIEEIVQILHKRKGTSILVNAMGNTFKRCLCIAGKRSGFHMVGFTHGDSVGMFKTKSFSYVEQSMVDTFVVPNQGSVELFSLSAQKFLSPLGKNVKILPNKTNPYKDIKQKCRAKKVSDSITSVMLLEFPLTDMYYPGSYGLFWAYQLDLNLRVATLIRQHKIRTVLKKHPDRSQESEGVYDRYYDELLVRPFEKVYEQADAYILPNIATSTFGFALLTNKPIIIFESSLEDVWEPASKLLRKRCRVIPSWVAEDGRLMFDEQALVAALRDPPNEPNDEFIERYMLS